MEKSTINRFAGIAGITSALLFITSIMGMQTYLTFNFDDVSAFTNEMVEAHTTMLLYGWPGFMATLLLIPFVYAFYEANSYTKHYSKIVLLITQIGFGFIMIAYLFHLSFTYFHAPMYQNLASEQQASFGFIMHATIGLQDMFWLGGDLLAFLGISLLLLLGLKETVFPKWLLIIGAVAGILAAAGSFSFLPAFKQLSWLGFFFIGGFSIFVIWQIVAGIFLIKLSRS